MQKISIFLLVILIISLVNCEDKTNSILIPEIIENQHVVNTDSVNAANNAANNVASRSADAPADVINTNDNKETKQDTNNLVDIPAIPPIAPMMPFMPKLSLFDSFKLLNPKNIVEDIIGKNKQNEQNGDSSSSSSSSSSSDDPKPVDLSNDEFHPIESTDQQPKRHGSLTLILFKSSINKDQQNNEASIDTKQTSDENNKDGTLIRSKLILFKIIPKRVLDIFGGNQNSDEFKPDQQQLPLIGADDLDNKRVDIKPHLLGGPDDLADRFRFNLGGETDPDNSLNNNEEPKSDENNKFIFKMPPILSFFQFHHRPPMKIDDGGLTASLSDDIGQNPPPPSSQPHVKKCMMLSFMRLKASIYYRTIIHLLFISGIIMLAMFMLLLSVRIYKRRKALRFYSQNMNISTIDLTNDEMKKQPPASRSFLLSFGSPAQQKQAEAAAYDSRSSLLIASQLPPTYEQLVNKETSKPKTRSS